MRLTILNANVPLTKTLSNNGQWSPYPGVATFSSKHVTIKNIRELHNAVVASGKKYECLLKGDTQEILIEESRAGITDSSEPTEWVCIDIDGIKGIKTPEEFLARYIPEWSSVSCSWAASARAGFTQDLRGHLLFMLNKKTPPAYLKDWLRWINLTRLQEQIALTRTGVALHWPVDVTTCQNDKLIYVSPPILPKGTEDPLAKDRYRLVNPKGKKTASLEGMDIPSAEWIKQKTKDLLAELRELAGLPPRKGKDTKWHGNTEVTRNIGEVRVTGLKRERGFVYLNINGGDSWGYFFPENRPEIVYNFKEENPFLLKEAVPELYAQLIEERNEALRPADDGETQYIAVLDKKSDRYFRGTYTPSTNSLELTPTDSLAKITSFWKQHGVPVLDFVPEWDVKYDFDSDVVYNEEERCLNLYKPTPFYTVAKDKVRNPPELINKVMTHALGGSAKHVHHFNRWFSWVFTRKQQTGTSWVLWGTEGTGKGLIFHTVLRPLLGSEYTFVTNGLHAFDREFNGFVERCLLCLVNEAQVGNLKAVGAAMARIKELITDPNVAIRKMRTDPYTAQNRLNLIFATNYHDPIVIAEDDRRFNVAPRQEQKLKEAVNLSNVSKRLEAELEDYAKFLHYIGESVTKNEVSEPIYSEEARLLKDITQSSIKQTANAINRGDLDYFWMNRPEVEDLSRLALDIPYSNVPPFTEVIAAIVSSLGKPMAVPRSYLESLFYFVSDLRCRTSHKFSQAMRHNGLNVTPMWVDGKTTRGVEIQWTVSNEVKKEIEKYLADIDKRKIKRVK